MLRQASTYLAAHTVSAVFGFLTITVFTRLLTPAEYGVYVVGMSVVGVLNAILFLWIRHSVVRFSHGGVESDMRLTALYCYLALILLSPLLIVVLGWTSGGDLWQIAAAVFVAFAMGVFDIYQDIFRNRQLPGRYAINLITRAVVAFGLAAILVLLGFGGMGLLVGVGLGYLVTTFISSKAIWVPPVNGFDKAILKKMLLFGGPMTISGAVFAFHSLMDRFIIVAFLGEAEAGAYGASADLVRQLILFPAVAIGSAIIPLAAKLLIEEKPEEAAAHLIKSSELLLAVLMPACTGLALVAPQLSFLMLGPEFRAYGIALIPVLAFSWLFQAFTQQYLHAAFHLGKKPSLMLVQGVLILLVNLAAMVALIPGHGLVGAAYAILIAEAVGALVAYLLSFKAHRMHIDVRAVVKVTLATVLMAISVIFVGGRIEAESIISLILIVSTGIVTYATAAFALNIVSIRTLALEWMRNYRDRNAV
ncbi:oligosaccharide flippase family protein [Roseibium sp. SCPC15]|uniref:lipopolysaccharide biosynthesis protein n=1 Tax=Roseibium sp. SCP15 TaxID=3141376 RepID=UPI003335EC04